MLRPIAILVAAVTVAVCLSQPILRSDLGRKEKLRILVDKVMQPERNWVTEEWMVRETAEAGFNVYSPRHGFDKPDAVRQVTDWCAQYGIYHLPWMRGTLEAPTGPEADGKRLVWGSGGEQSLYSPNADEFWEWTTKYIVEYAKLSKESPHLFGVFLDYENYSARSEGNCYDLSYDDVILAKFALSVGADPRVRPLPLSERKKWLEDQGLLDAFAEFQVNHWRERCRTLRQAIDAIDPTFRFCIYPAPGTPFMVKACYPEWATEQAPLILADPWTYGRPSRFLPQRESLEGNLRKLQDGMKIPREAGIPFIYAGGIDPVVAGADPEFCGKNAVMISEATDGYWIFYEGPAYNTTHPEYFKWFGWANEHIRQGAFAAWHEPREEPENWALGIFGSPGAQIKLVPPPVTGEKITFPKVTMRGENLLFVAAKQGRPVEIALRNIQVGNYTSLLAWELRNPKMENVAKGMIEHKGEGTATFTPEMDGLYLLGLSAGSCSYSVLSSNAPLAILAAEGVGLIGPQERLYFSVPAGLSEFTLSAKGAGVETVRVTVFDPSGAQVATDQTTPAEQSVTLKVPTGASAGQTWSLSTSRADQGVLEDQTLRLDPKLPPVLSLSPSHAFTASPP
ncbi:MAG: hypothetical protein FJX75_20680 [Armatimonadetes bacterium]|nr:hypothetical protein [Armatimonadota bacterium]